MTLIKSEPGALFFADAPPQSGNLRDVVSWADRQFQALAIFMRRPEFAGVVFTRVDTTVAEEFKAENGLMLYAGPGVLGPQEGFYVREGNSWKKLAGT